MPALVSAYEGSGASTPTVAAAPPTVAAAPPTASGGAPSTEVEQLVERLVRVLAQHQDNLVRRGEPRGYGTKWWRGEKLAVAADDDEVLLGASMLAGEAFEEGEGSLVAELEAARVKRARELERRYERERSEYGARPDAKLKRAEEHRRAQVRTEATSHCLEAVSLLRARTDLLVHRLPRIGRDESDALALLAGVIARTPIIGTVDLATPHGGLGGAQWGTPGSAYGSVADPEMLAAAIREVEYLSVAAEGPPASRQGARIVGLTPWPTLAPSKTDPRLRPGWETAGGEPFPGLTGPLARAYPGWDPPGPRRQWLDDGHAAADHNGRPGWAPPRVESAAPALAAYADLGRSDPFDEGVLERRGGGGARNLKTRDRFEPPPLYRESRPPSSRAGGGGGAGGGGVPTTCLDVGRQARCSRVGAGADGATAPFTTGPAPAAPRPSSDANGSVARRGVSCAGDPLLARPKAEPEAPPAGRLPPPPSSSPSRLAAAAGARSRVGGLQPLGPPR